MNRFMARHPTSPAKASRIRYGTILSVAMLLRHSLDLPKEAAAVEKAVREVIAEGVRTADIAAGSSPCDDRSGRRRGPGQDPELKS